MSSREGFLAWTISVCSIEVLPCRQGGIWNKPMAPHGWRCSARTWRRLAVELAAHDTMYDEMAAKFFEHFLWIAAGMNGSGREGMWDEKDGFYYDLLRLPDGSGTRLKVRSMVGLLPLCATTVIEPWQRERVPRALRLMRERREDARSVSVDSSYR